MISEYYSEIDQENAQKYFKEKALQLQRNISTSRLFDSKLILKYIVNNLRHFSFNLLIYYNEI